MQYGAESQLGASLGGDAERQVFNGRDFKSMTGATFAMAARREAMIDQALHLVGIAAAVVGSLVLLHSVDAAGRPELVMPVGLYIGSLFSTLVCSAFYNGAARSPWRPVLRRLDHAAIFLLIAGTYSPFLCGATGDPMVDIAYAGVWIVAAAGMLTQLLFHSRFQKRLSVTLYLALGWSVLLVIGPVSAILPSKVLWLIALGGVLYTIGVVFHLTERILYQNAIWHGFVMTAAGIHFLAVLTFVRS